MASRIGRVVILGGGTAGWMTAAALASQFGRALDITLIESDEIGIVGVGEATIPTIHWFNALIGLTDAELIAATKASFKLGIQFVDWARPGHRYFHPFGIYGMPLGNVDFLPLWLRAGREAEAGPIADYSLATEAAMAAKMGLPSGDPSSILSTLGYAYHFDASLYARHLRERTLAAGVRRHEGKVTDIAHDPESGFVTALTSDRGEVLEGDLFVDCSGLRALLIGETMGVGFEDWSCWLPCNRAFAVPTENAGPLHPFTRSTARRAGWQWRIPLQHRTGNGYVFSSAFEEEDAAAELLLANLDGEPLADPRLIRFRTGKREKMWDKNVVAIGLSSGFLEPLESTSIHLIQSGIAKLLALFPDQDCDPLLADRFNDLFTRDMHCIRDFLLLHYTQTEGRDEPLWAHCRKMDVPDSLTRRIDAFRNGARVMIDPDELFRETSWIAVMLGQGIMPVGYPALADLPPRAAVDAHLARLRGAITTAAASFPDHEAVLARIVAGEAAKAKVSAA